MNHSSVVWKCIIILFSFYIQNLLPAVCLSFNTLGYMTFQPAPPLQIGSNLTVYCHITKFQYTQEWFDISLALNGETVDSWRRINRTTMMFSLPSVSMPEFTVLCKLRDWQSRIVVGQKLHAGLPPDKPVDISCETTRSSNVTDCSWTRGRETFLPTSYNISLTRENGTQIYFDKVKAAEKVTISRAMLDKNTTYELVITAYNHFGESRSDSFSLCIMDTVIPDTPHITNVEFKNNSITAFLHWKTSESSPNIRLYLRLRSSNVSWAVKEITELRRGLIQVDNLRALTGYEFQIQTCESRSNTSSFTTAPNTSRRTLCSKWSQSVKKTSPGKGPSKQLDVWRTFSHQGKDGMQAVTVLWKPPPPEDYSGEVHQYQIFWLSDQKREVNCSAAESQWLVQVPADVQTLSVSAVTSYGTSPPAEVVLTYTGILGPVLEELSPTADGSTLLISWRRREDKQGSTQGGELLYWVMEWTSIPGAGLQWEKLGKDLRNMSITGLTAGLRYSVSLHAVTSRGVSAPSSRLFYSSEKTPVSGPNLSVLIHEARRIQIQWDELPVDQRRGFITKYTIYIQTLDYSSLGFNESVSANGERQVWLDCPEGALTLKMTASNSAGEGPSGRRIASLPPDPAVNLVIVIVIVTTTFIGIVANLMCCTSVRKRVKQQCISWGPAWLVENLPKPERSNAIRLLEHEGSEAFFFSIHSDPPLSPLIVLSQEERDEVYPTIHIEHPASGLRDRAETPSLSPDTWTELVDRQLEHRGYKPQLAAFAHQEEETKEEEEEEEEEEKQIHLPTNKEEEGSPCSPDGLKMTCFFFDVDVDFSDSHRELIHSSVNGLLLPRNVEKRELNRDVINTRGEIEGDVRLDCPSLGFKHDDTGTPDMTDACWAQCSGDATLNGGYFPQRAPVRGSTP